MHTSSPGSPSSASRGVVVVTGASSGLGAEMARQFAALGWDLALCARRTNRLDALAYVWAWALEGTDPPAPGPGDLALTFDCAA